MSAAVILAAGRSARLGHPKQLVELDGEPLVRRAARVALEAGCSPVLLVEGAVPLAPVVAGLPVEVVHCAPWADGPGASLRAGVLALEARADSVLVLLADQYRVRAEDLVALMSAPGPVAAAAYAGTLGVPARFDGEFLEVLRALPAAQGAKRWLQANQAQVTAVALPHAELDLDTPEALAEARRDPAGRT